MYTTIKAYCFDQTLQVSSVPKLASGGKKVNRLEVTFNEYWDGYGKTAVFYRKKEQVYHVVMTSDACVIPHEVTTEPGTLFVGIIGSDNSGSTRTSTVVALTVAQGAITGLDPFTPLPDVYQQVLAAYAQTEKAVSVERERIDNLLSAKTTDGELIDIRVGADGHTYTSAGAAVRAQIGFSLLWRTAPAYDADQCTGIGFYFVGGSENWVNIPGVAGMLISFYGNTEHRLYQMFFEYGTEGHVYTRHHQGSSGFTAWMRLATNAEVLDAHAEYTIEKQSPTLVYIYKRGAKGFVRYDVGRTTNSEINQDVWRLTSVYLCDKSKNGVKAVSTFGADLEGVVLLESAADHIGGVHGDETTTEYKLFIDGREYTFDGELPDTANEIRLIAKSFLTHVDTSDVCMNRIKQLTFDKDGVHIRNEWEALEALSIQSVRACMFSVQKDCITHYYDSNVSLYPVTVSETTENSLALSENSNMVDVYYVGDATVHHWAGVRGGDASQYSTLLQDYGPRLKSYFNCYDWHKATNGEKMVAENHFTVSY